VAVVHVPQNEAAPVIRTLLEAAAELGLPASVVATASDGVFGFSLIVPDEVLARTQPKATPADGEAVAPKKKVGRPRKEQE
jgi:hypothetical protein